MEYCYSIVYICRTYQPHPQLRLATSRIIRTCRQKYSVDLILGTCSEAHCEFSFMTDLNREEKTVAPLRTGCDLHEDLDV
eukprot:6177016-Pleurochrysis_carterae.AAC.5